MNSNKTFNSHCIDYFLSQLKAKKIAPYNIPNDILFNEKIIIFESQAELRENDCNGFDIVNNCFFSTDIIYDFDMLTYQKRTCFFYDFDSFYCAVQGNIYENSCFYQYVFPQTDIKNIKLI